ncbi:hypothetical protein KFL_001390290 [Klebsormidium nitens]|uniref:Uncharacterized protein n=1 Tax=Klebsormidium nitens TaxID=105231 RepID=A0A1Y1I207_KLENI|nr:hypothetical protein KFL_001390290 [Klebsormidium nitens]|eukprot:GAQ83211.1 hypothetical protein KFL_001390290 [Klebsormidium nitens]
MAKKTKRAVADLVNHIEDIFERNALEGQEEFSGIVDKLGSYPSAISEEEQNQLKIKPSKEFKAITRLLKTETFVEALLGNLDNATSNHQLEAHLRCVTKLSSVFNFAEQLGRSESAPCLLRLADRLIAQTPCPPEEQESARNVEFYFAFVTSNLLKASLDFRESGCIPDLVHQFQAVFRRKWELEWPGVTGVHQLSSVAFSIQQVVFALQAFAESVLQSVAQAVTGEWIADLFCFIDQTWDRLLREAMPPDVGPVTLETLVDSCGRLLVVLVDGDFKELPGVQTRLEHFARVVNLKLIPRLKSDIVVSPHILPRVGHRVAFLLGALKSLSLEKGDETEGERSSPGAGNTVDFSEAIALVQSGNWQQAGSLLNSTARRLEEHGTRARAEALVAKGFVESVFKILALALPEESVDRTAIAATEGRSQKSAFILGGVNLLVAVLPELDETKPSSRKLFLTTGVRLLQWCEDLLSREGSLDEDAMNRVLGLLTQMEIARRRELSERMQILYVDLAISAIKLYPFTATSHIGWATLKNLKTFTLKFGERSPGRGAAERTDVNAEEYLWRPSSEEDPSDAGAYNSRAMWNMSGVFNKERRLLSRLALEHLRHAVRSETSFFGVAAAILSVLHACCRDRLVVQCAVLPRIETIVHSLHLVHGSLVAVFGPLCADDPPREPGRDEAATLDMMCELEVAHDDLTELIATILDALKNLPGPMVIVRDGTLLEAACAGAAAACAGVLRDLRALQRVAPFEAAEETWVQLEGAQIWSGGVP